MSDAIAADADGSVDGELVRGAFVRRRESESAWLSMFSTMEPQGEDERGLECDSVESAVTGNIGAATIRARSVSVVSDESPKVLIETDELGAT